MKTLIAISAALILAALAALAYLLQDPPSD